MTSHRPRKRFGQHFLHDPAVIDRIVAAVAPAADQHLVEIGPGLGVLTRPLLAAGVEIDVIEVDRDLAARLADLDDTVAGRLRVHNTDALETDFCALADTRPLRIVGNLPYNISTPLLFRLLSQRRCIEDMHFMLQREVVDRMSAAPGSRTYGRLSVMVQYACAVERLFIIGPGAFRPAPKVDSAFVRLIPYARPPVDAGDEAALQRVVRRAFSARRKTLRNALKGMLDAEDLEAAQINPAQRPEQVDLAGYGRLAARLTARSRE